MIRILMIIALLATFSCRPTIEFDSLQAESKLVIWCFLHPDSVVTASLTKTIPIFEPDADKKVTDGIVVIYENNTIWDTLRNDGTDKYMSNKGLHPKAGNIYSIKAYKIGFKTLETKNDTMPSKPIVQNWTAVDSFTLSNYSYINGRKAILAKVHLSTNISGNFPIYGVNLIKATGLRTWESVGEDIDPKCPRIVGVTGRGFRFNYSNCNEKQGEKNLFIINAQPDLFKKVKLKFNLCSSTYQFQQFYAAFKDFENSYRDQAFDLYATPVTFPEFIKNGYGFFACYNTSDEINVNF